MINDPSFVDVLKFCEEPRTRKEIMEHFEMGNVQSWTLAKKLKKYSEFTCYIDFFKPGSPHVFKARFEIIKKLRENPNLFD